MRILLTLILFILATQFSFGQVDNTTRNKIKAYFLTAEELYKNGEYSKSLDKIIEIESLTNGVKLTTTQNLKIKALIGKSSFQMAKNELDLLYSLNPSDDIFKDIAKYSSAIDAGLDAEKKAEVRELLKVFNSKPNITLVAQKQNDKWGFVNKSNKFVIPPLYDSASNMVSERAFVLKDGKYGVINNQNEAVIPIVNDNVFMMNNTFTYKISGRYFITDRSGKLLSSQEGCVNSYSRGAYATCETGDKTDAINTFNSHLIKDVDFFVWYQDYSYDDNFYYITKSNYSNLYYFFDESGDFVLEPSTNHIGIPSFDAFTGKPRTNIYIVSGETYSAKPVKFYNARTKKTVTYSYTEEESSSKSLMQLKPDYSGGSKKIYENGKVGFVTDKAVITPKYNKVEMSYGRYTFVTGDNGDGIVDDTGKVIVPLKYSKIKYKRSSDDNIELWYAVKQGRDIDVYDKWGKFKGAATLRN